MILVEKAAHPLHERRWVAAVLGLALFVAIALADLLTPEALSFSLFYFVPIALLAWYNGGAWPWLAAFAGALLWPGDHLVKGELDHFRSVAAYWEPAVRIGSYAVFIVSLAVIKDYLARLRDANRDLHESEERYRQVFEHSSSGIILLDVTPDLRFRIVAFNPAVERMSGVLASRVTGQFIDEVLPADLAEQLSANYRRCVQAGSPIAVQASLDLPVGRRSIHTTQIPLKDQAGRVHRLIALPVDLTEKQRAEDALRESEQRYREVFENTSDGIFLIDVTPDGRFRVAAYNPAMERMVGLTNASVAGRYNEDFLSPDTAAEVTANNRRCIEAGAPISFDEELDLPAGHFLWHTTLVPVRDASGAIHRLVGVSRDVTETVRAQRALRQSEAKFSTAFRASPDSITISRLEDGVLREVNQVFTEAYGFSREEAVGRSALELGIWVNPEERQRLAALLRADGKATGFEATFRRRDGQLRYGMLSSSVVEIDGEICILNIARDMTEHRRMEETVRESEQRYREIVENTSDGIFVVEVTEDDRFRLLSYNPAQERMLGISAANAVGKYTNEYLPPQLAQEVVEQNRQCIEAGKSMSFEAAVDLPSGRSFFNTTLVPVRDASGRIARLVGVTQDLTERKRAQDREREQEQQLFQAAKLASLGTLVSGIAHEINNPNNYIRLNAQNLQAFWPHIRSILDREAGSEDGLSLQGVPFSTARGMVEDLLNGIEEGSKRIEKLVVNLRDFARGEEGELAEQVDVNAVIDSAVMIVADLIEKSTDSFAVSKAPGLPAVRGSYHQIEQVVINLVTNACQALASRDRRIGISTRADVESRSVIVEVEDEGEGMPPENLARITDPFFTTKRSRGGSGLGLAVSARIVTNHGGALTFTSEVGQGTRAKIQLPANP
jgi:PAS domain S-box-containing protein